MVGNDTSDSRDTDDDPAILSVLLISSHNTPPGVSAQRHANFTSASPTKLRSDAPTRLRRACSWRGAIAGLDESQRTTRHPSCALTADQSACKRAQAIARNLHATLPYHPCGTNPGRTNQGSQAPVNFVPLRLLRSSRTSRTRDTNRISFPSGLQCLPQLQMCCVARLPRHHLVEDTSAARGRERVRSLQVFDTRSQHVQCVDHPSIPSHLLRTPQHRQCFTAFSLQPAPWSWTTTTKR